MFTANNPSATVKITFSSIDLFTNPLLIFSQNKDRVEVYECTTNDCSDKNLLHSLDGSDFMITFLRSTNPFPFDVLGSTPVMMVKFITFEPSLSRDRVYTGFDATFSEIAQASSEPPAPRIPNFWSDLGSLYDDMLSGQASHEIPTIVGNFVGRNRDIVTPTPIQNSSNFSIIAALTAAPLYIVETNDDTLEIPDPALKDPEWQSEVFIEASAAGSSGSNDITFSNYEVAVTPQTPYHVPYSAPAWSWCTPGVDCPPGGDTCSYGYPYNGWACASGCSQQAGSGPAQCSQSTCCSCTARPPDNGQIKKPGESFVSQVYNPRRL
jgi:hypothetical protein